MALAFIDAVVFVGDGKVLDRATVIVEGKRIVKVAEGNPPVPRDARRIDLSGRTLFPGFIDCHVHLCLDGSPNPANSTHRTSLPAMTLKAAESAYLTLLAGVTTVRDMGGKEYIDLAIRDAITAGLIPGPRIQASARAICMTGGHGWTFGGQEADGPDGVRKAVREQIKAGADLIKFMATGGVMTPGIEPGSAQLTEEELRAGIEEAHKAGRKTAAHAQGAQGILNALRAGIDTVEHGSIMDEEGAFFMVKHDRYLVPTLAAGFNILSHGVEQGLPDYVIEKALRIKPLKIESFRNTLKAGVKIGAGTDAGTPFNRHGNNLNELKLLVEWGLDPMEAIKAGTGNAAQILGLERELGTVEEGKLADLVAVEGSPLDDIDLLTRKEAVHLVMKNGQIVKEDGVNVINKRPKLITESSL